MRYLPVIAILVTLSGCCTAKSLLTSADPANSNLCSDACIHLRVLGCPEGDPLEDGTACEQFCLETQKAGHPLNLTCVIGMTACSELDTVCTKAPETGCH
jgi:hypothetical protein